jgi:FkbM family methyltransferase
MVRWIMDIGANCGQSTALFLADERESFSVLAVEPDPALFRRLRSRFQAHIETGRLLVAERAIYHEDGPATTTLYVNEADCEWSSTYRECGERYGTTATAVDVRTTTMAKLYSMVAAASAASPPPKKRKTIGVPSPGAVVCYIKIDIEGSDGICLRQLRDSCAPELLPPYLSFELNCWPDLRLAHRDLGYTRFKLVPQSANKVSAPTGDDAVPLSGGALWSSGPWGEDAVDVHGRRGDRSWVDMATLERDIKNYCVSHVTVPPLASHDPPARKEAQLAEGSKRQQPPPEHEATQEQFLASRPVFVQRKWSCLRSPFPLESRDSEQWFDVHCSGLSPISNDRGAFDVGGAS